MQLTQRTQDKSRQVLEIILARREAQVRKPLDQGLERKVLLKLRQIEPRAVMLCLAERQVTRGVRPVGTRGDGLRSPGDRD